MSDLGESEELLYKRRSDPESPPVRRRVVLIELVIALYFISRLITVPVTQFYIYEKIADRYGIEHFASLSSSETCTNSSKHQSEDSNQTVTDKIQKEASVQFMYVQFLGHLPAILPTLFLGSIADRFGRKKSLLVSFGGCLTRQVIYTIVIYQDLPFWCLYIGNAIEGLTGFFGAVTMVMFAVIADVTQVGKERAFRIALAEAIMSIVAGITLFSTGYWIKYSGFKIPMLVATIITLVNILLMLFIIPETLRQRQTLHNVCGLKHFTQCYGYYFRDTPDRRRWKMIAAMFCFICMVCAYVAKSGVWVLFLLNTPLCWTQLHVNVVSAIVLVLNWVVSLVCLRLLQIKLSVTAIAILGAVSGAVAQAFQAFGTVDWWIYVSIGIGVLIALVIPMMRTVLSRLTSPQEQGSLFAGISSVEMLVIAILDVVYMTVYKQTEARFPGATFLIMTGFLVIAIVLSCILHIGLKRQPSPTEIFERNQT